MTQEEFNKLWISNYPETVPISYLFKHDCADRWFRIHSMPDSKRYPDNDEGEVYRPAYTETIWSLNKHDELLRKVARDNILAFFVSFDRKVIIAPYDGGVDLILKDSLTRDFYKNKYKEWISTRDDGL